MKAVGEKSNEQNANQERFSTEREGDIYLFIYLFVNVW